MKILVTGGAGFIGAHVAKALLDRGDDVVLLDNLSSLVYPAAFKEQRITQLFAPGRRPRLINGSVLDAELLDTVFREEEFDRVLHFAALANTELSLRYPDVFTEVNVVGTLNVLRAATRHDIVQLIFAGSSSVYSDEQTPFREDQWPLRPRSPYGASKAAAELYCGMWHDLYGLPITVLRFFTVYGPWGRPDMAPMIFAGRLLDDLQIEVTADRARDFTYIDDIVAGVVAALERKFDFEIINLGFGQPVKLEDLVAAFEKATGKQAAIVSRPAPPGEMRTTYADTGKARKLLDWQPQVPVATGAAKLVQWLKSRR